MFANMLNEIVSLDNTIDVWVVTKQNAIIKKLFFAVTFFGYGAVWIVFYPFFFYFGDDQMRACIASLIFCEIIGCLVIIFLRNMFKRLRPQNMGRTIPFCPWNDWSFPSHHAFRSVILTVCFSFFYPNATLFLIVFATLICLSRLYLRRHYLSDVVAGIILASGCAAISIYSKIGEIFIS